MERLSYQDSAFLRLDGPPHPFHVGGLMIFAPPSGTGRPDLRRLRERLARELPEVDPLFLRMLGSDERHWIRTRSFDARYHLHHYALPQGGTIAELLELVARVHERPLERGRPLWEWHLIEGLPRGRFALYCKMHHALLDGVGALQLMDRLLGTDSLRDGLHTSEPATSGPVAGRRRDGWLGNLGNAAEALLEQGRALPELAGLLLRMCADRGANHPPLPFSAPRAAMNHPISSRRCIVVADFSLPLLRRMGRAADATINDVLLALSGAALRAYLRKIGKLPRASLLAGVPVSLKTDGESHGNQLSTIICPLGTTTSAPLRRLRSIARTTRRAKRDLRSLSRTARQDYMNLILLPTMLLTLAHAPTAVPPPFNIIVSNVPGPSGARYLAGSRLEAVYPLSIVHDAMALNITAVSCGSRLCIAVTACPDSLPGIEHFATHLRTSVQELRTAALG